MSISFWPLFGSAPSQRSKHHRRVHPGMSGDPDRSKAELDQRRRRLARSVHPARRARPYTLGQWAGICRQGSAGIDRRRGCQNRVHQAGQPAGERQLRELQRPTAGRTSQRRDLLLAGQGQGCDRKLASPLQHGTSALVIGLPPAGTARPAMAGFATRTSFAGHASLGAKAAHELRFVLDHPVGADHSPSRPMRFASRDWRTISISARSRCRWPRPRSACPSACRSARDTVARTSSWPWRQNCRPPCSSAIWSLKTKREPAEAAASGRHGDDQRALDVRRSASMVRAMPVPKSISGRNPIVTAAQV